MPRPISPDAKFHRDFPRDTNRLREMLALHASGWPIIWLSEKYQKDRSAIRHHIRKFSIIMVSPSWRGSRRVPTPVRPVLEVKTVGRKKKRQEPIKKDTRLWYIDEFGERVCRGKSYMDYVEDHKSRDPLFRFTINPVGVDPDHIS